MSTRRYQTTVDYPTTILQELCRVSLIFLTGRIDCMHGCCSGLVVAQPSRWRPDRATFLVLACFETFRCASRFLLGTTLLLCWHGAAACLSAARSRSSSTESESPRQGRSRTANLLRFTGANKKKDKEKGEGLPRREASPARSVAYHQARFGREPN